MVQPVDANKGKYSSDFQLQLNLQKGLAPIESDTDCQARLNMAYLLCNCFIGCLAPKEVVHFHPFYHIARCFGLRDAKWKTSLSSLQSRTSAAASQNGCLILTCVLPKYRHCIYRANLSARFFQTYQLSNPKKRVGNEIYQVATLLYSEA